MTALFVLAILVGLDNLQVSASVGLMPVRPARKWLIAAAFGLCEGLMPLAGLLLGKALHQGFESWVEAAEPVILLACGGAILVLALREQDSERFANSRWLLFGLPLSLSFDNLFAGLALGTLGYPVVFAALVVGLVSTSLCVAGLYLGGRLRRWLPDRAELLSGAYLVLLAMIQFFGET